MRKILTLITLAGLLFVAAAQAQQYGAVTFISDAYVLTNSSAVTGNTTNGTVIAGVTKYDQGLLEVDFKLTGAGVSGDNPSISWYLGGTTNTTTLAPSANTASITQNGVTTVRWATNLNIGSAGYLKVLFTTPTNNCVTNLNVKLWEKPRRQG